MKNTRRDPIFERQRLDSPPWPWGPDTSLIWHPDEVETHYETPRQSYLAFRKTFALEALPPTASLAIFADSRYLLYVNGNYLAFGPGRSDPRWQSYDTHDIGPFLQPGENVVAALVLYFGYGTGQHISRVPALIAEITLGTQVMGTDKGWKCAFHPAFDRGAPRINGCQGPVEIFDARQDIPGWTNTPFDDRNWAIPKTRGPKLSPFWNWEMRAIPHLAESVIPAHRIISKGTFVSCPIPEKGLHHQILAETQTISLEDSSDPLVGHVVESSLPEKGAIRTIDFGTVVVGRLILSISGTPGDVLDVVYAESLHEGKAILQESSYRAFDRLVVGAGITHWEISFGWKAFRYVQIRFRNQVGNIEIHRVQVRHRWANLPQRGSFSCPDENLNKIWEISSHTLRISQQDGFLDSPSREQQQWVGDGRWQALYSQVISRDHRLHRQLVRLFIRSQDFQGLTTSRYPDGHHNYPPIPSFCLHGICSTREYLDATGDTGVVAEIWPNLVLAARWFTAFLNTQHLLENVPYWPFIDWGESPFGLGPDDQRGGVVTALNIAYVEALRAMEYMAKTLGDKVAASAFRRQHRQTASAVTTLLFDPKSQGYPDSWVDGTFGDRHSESTYAMALLHLHPSGHPRAKILLAKLLAHLFDPMDTPAPRLIFASPFFMPVLSRALIKHGFAKEALRHIQARYLPMIEAGATTTWENWKLFYSRDGKVSFNSACHGWGASPLLFVAETLLGVKACPKVKAGDNEIYTFNPNLCGLDQAQGAVATGSGALEISLKKTSHGKEIELEIPLNVEVRYLNKRLKPGSHHLRTAP